MPAFSNLDGHRYLSLTTYRKSGEAVPTPIWFAKDGDTLYAITMEQSGKVKRIRHTAQVEVSPCTSSGEILGEAAAGLARVLDADGAEAANANAALDRRYGAEKARVEANNPDSVRVFLAVVPSI